MQDRKIGNLLFLTFWMVYLLTALGTLGMLFLGFGTVLDGERGTLINVFLVESAIAIFALFYSVFGLKKTEKPLQDSPELSKLKAELKKKDVLISQLQNDIEKLESLKTEDDSYEWKYRDAIIALCSSKSNMAIPDIVKTLGLEGDDKLKLYEDIGRMKRQGTLINDNVLYADSVKLVV